MPGPLWVVTGGSETVGIVVRRSCALDSVSLGRLSKTAIVEEIEVTGSRLHFAKVEGEGPAYGWASIRLPNGKPLLARLWEAAGIEGEAWPVYTQPFLSHEHGGDSLAAKENLKLERLAPQAVVMELDLQDSMLQFQLLRGQGPVTGWIHLTEPSSGMKSLKRQYAHYYTKKDGNVAQKRQKRKPFEVQDGVEFWPLDWFSARWLRERCATWELSPEDVLARAARSALPHIGIDRSGEDSATSGLSAELGWQHTAPAGNPVDDKKYAAPMMTAEEFHRIEVPLEEVDRKLARVMEEHGCAVVTGVLSASEVETFEGLFKMDLEEMVDASLVNESPPQVKAAWTRFQQDGVGAFPLATAAKMTGSAGFGIKHCIMQGRMAWAVRMNDNVHRCFRALYHTGEQDQEQEQLVTSMDVTFFTPHGGSPQQASKFSAHVDQNRYDCREGLSDCEVYQGALYIWPVDSISSTTALWPGSHLEAYERIMQDPAFRRTGGQGRHYCEIAAMQDKPSAKRLADGWARRARRVPSPAGSLLLWSSRLVHAAWSGGPRLAQAVCLEPSRRRSESARLAKMRLAALGLPSAHWAQVAMQHDMALGDAGYFHEPIPAKVLEGEFASEEEDLVVLPLKRSTRPAALVEDTDLEGLEKLIRVTYQTAGVWVRSSGFEAILESKIEQKYKSLL